MYRSTYEDNKILHDIDAGIDFKLGKYDFKRREDKNKLTGDIERVSVEAEGYLEFKSSALKYHVNIISPLYAHHLSFIHDVYIIEISLTQNDRFRLYSNNSITRELLRDAIDTSGNIFLHIIKEVEHSLRLFLIKELLTDVNGVDDIIIDFLADKLKIDKSKVTHAIYNAARFDNGF